MKAILNTKGVFSKFNFLSFEIVEFNGNYIGLNINGTITDFKVSEVFIENFKEELQEAYDLYNWSGPNKKYTTLLVYKKEKEINFKPQYNCPA